MIPYEIVRSERKTVALQVKEGRILVRAPRYLPDSRIREIIKQHEAWIRKRIEEKPEVLTEEQMQALYEKARRILPDRVRYYSAQMGLKPSAVRINRAKTRFGSCSSQGSINFSCRLLQCPKEAVDYVVVHELAHLRFMNHGKEFYRLIETYLPDYRERKKRLKEVGEDVYD